MRIRKSCRYLILALFLILLLSSIARSEVIWGLTGKDWEIQKWYELIKIDDNDISVWTKVKFEFPNSSADHDFYLELAMPYEIEEFYIFPRDNTTKGSFLNYSLEDAKKLKIRLNSSVARKYRSYEICFYYKVNDIINEKSIWWDYTRRWSLYTTLNIDNLIPEKYKKDNGSTVNVFIVLPEQTTEYHTNIPMIVIPPERFASSYSEKFRKLVYYDRQNKENESEIQWPKISIESTQPVLYYISGRSPYIDIKYNFNDLYVEYSTTNIWIVSISVLAAIFGAGYPIVLSLRRLINWAKRKS